MWQKTIYPGLEVREGRWFYSQRQSGNLSYLRTQGAWLNIGWRRERNKNVAWLGGLKKLPWVRNFSIVWHDKAQRRFSCQIDLDSRWPRATSIDMRWRRLTVSLPLPMALYNWAQRREEKRRFAEEEAFDDAMLAHGIDDADFDWKS